MEILKRRSRTNGEIMNYLIKVKGKNYEKEEKGKGLKKLLEAGEKMIQEIQD